MIVIGVDPGEDTGIALHDGEQVTAAWESPNDDAVDWLWDYCHAVLLRHDETKVHVAVERFVITQGTVRTSRGDENWSIETIGVTRHLCRRLGHRFTLQDTASAKKMSPNKKLKEHGIWVKGTKGHAIDAIRVALHARAEHYNIVPPWV